MAKQRAATNLAEFVKFQTVGAAIFGVVARQGENGNGQFVVMEPAAFRASGSVPFQRYAELAVGLSTDLASKVATTDTGKLLLFVFVGTKPTSKDPLKLFNVLELEPDEARQLIAGGDMAPEWMEAPATAISSQVSTKQQPLF